MSSSITQLAPLLPGDVNGQYDVIPIVSVGEIAPNGSMGVTHKITVENLAYVIGSNINPEIIMDTVAAHLVGGTGIAIVYDDLNDLLTISNTYTPPVGLLKVQNPLSTTLQVVQDGNNTNSQLYLATDKTQVQGTLRITTNNNPYIDAEDGAGNNRFTVGRDSASQQVNVDFASNPTGSTTTVGAIRTYQDGVNLSEVMSFREDGNVGIGTTSPTSRLLVKGSGTTGSTTSFVAQNSSGTEYWAIQDNGTIRIANNQAFRNLTSNGTNYFDCGNIVVRDGDISNANSSISIGTGSATTSRLQIQGKGSTSATTSLLVQNSGGNTSLSVLDNQNVGIGTTASSTLKLNVVGATSDGVIRVAGPYSDIQLVNKNSPYNTGDWKPTIQFLENGVFTAGIAYSGSYFEFGAGISSTSAIIGSTLTVNSGTLNLYGGGQTITFTDTVFGVTRGFIELTNTGAPFTYNMNVRTNSGDINFLTGGANTRLTIKQAGNVGIGTSTPNASAILQADSTTQGFLPPRMTNAQRAAITSPATGLQVYNTEQGLQVYNGTSWVTVGNGGGLINTNTAVGTEAGLSNTTGSNNTALGYRSLRANTSGTQNVAVGVDALMNNTTPNANTAIGYTALTTNTTGTENTAIGREALYSNTIGNYNVSTGVASLYANTTGNNNTAYGTYALGSNVSGSANVAVGKSSLTNNTASNNTAVGYQAGYSNTSGFYNVALGYSSLKANTTGSYITAVGYEALFNATTGIANVAIGRQTLYSLTTGSNNTAIGDFCMAGSNGDGNVAIGQNTIASGNNNVVIGRFADSQYNGSLVLGYGATATGNNQAIFGSAGTNAGAVTNEVNSSTKVWNVKINGVDYKILLA